MAMWRPKRSRKKKVDLDGQSRRDFLRYSLAMGAFFGLDRWRVFEVVGDLGGTALADEVACAISCRSVHIVSGNGGFGWFQLLWPHIDVALARNASFSFHDPAKATMVAGTDKPLILGPEAPWRSLGPERQVTAFMAGTNEFPPHTDAPRSTSTVDQGKGLFAVCAALQSANPTLVPVIAVRTEKASMPYGGFAGAPSMAEVSNAASMVGLFDSAAASATGPLSTPQNAFLFEAYYKGFLGFQAAAGRPTYARGFHTGKTASRLVGVSLSNQLRPGPADHVRYGLAANTPSKLMEIANTLITTAKAFKLGLTSCVILPAFNDDPHEAFGDLSVLRSTVKTLGNILDGFLKDLDVPDPQCGGARISDNLVMTFHGDTPKTPLKAAAWPDEMPGNSNWVYALGAGWLRSGWYGGILRDGNIVGFDPGTGADMRGQSSSTTSTPAAGAIAYAVAKGDMRRVGDYYRGPDFSGVVRPKIL